eukprot:EG_transcript_7930
MPTLAAAQEPYPAVAAPAETETETETKAGHSVVGTVVAVGQSNKNTSSRHAQLQCAAVISTENRHLRVVSHITEGVWASVYEVREEETGAPFALKVIPIKGTNVESAHTTLEMLKRLPHQNILQCFGQFAVTLADVPCLCIQLELCGSGTLARYLNATASQKGTLPAPRVQDYATQLASALAFIHGEGFLHGDFRSESVLVTRDGKQLKLTNFGSPQRIDCRGLSSWTITGGCKTYAPPEWMDSTAPHRALRAWETPLPSYDMWGFGCVLSELVTLKLLRHHRQYLYTAVAADPAGLQGIAREVAATHGGLFAPLLGRLLEPDPDTRLSSPEALQALRSLQQPTPTARRLVAALRRPLSRLHPASHPQPAPSPVVD